MSEEIIFDPKDLISVNDAAKLLGLSRQTIYNKIETGEFNAYTTPGGKKLKKGELLSSIKPIFSENGNGKGARTIVIINQKGGVGKTYTSVNLCGSLSTKGFKVLGIDLDPQHNFTTTMLYDISYNHTIADFFDEQAFIPLEKCIVATSNRNISIIPSSYKLSALEIQVTMSKYSDSSLFRDNLIPLLEKFDFIIVDCPPSLGIYSINALVAADSVIIPVQPERFPLEGMEHLYRSIEQANNYRKRKNISPIHIEGVLINNYERKTVLSSDYMEVIKAQFGEKVFNTKIHNRVVLKEAISLHKTIHDYKPNSESAKEYSKLIEEIIRHDQ